MNKEERFIEALVVATAMGTLTTAERMPLLSYVEAYDAPSCPCAVCGWDQCEH